MQSGLRRLVLRSELTHALEKLVCQAVNTSKLQGLSYLHGHYCSLMIMEPVEDVSKRFKCIHDHEYESATVCNLMIVSHEDMKAFNTSCHAF